MTRALLWKEWREQRWKMAFGRVMLCGFCAIGLQTRLIPDVVVWRPVPFDLCRLAVTAAVAHHGHTASLAR